MPILKDIAKACNVSTSTVSRILNYDLTLKVQESTRQAVFEKAKALGYVKKKRKSSILNNNFKVGIIQWYSMEKELIDPFYLSIRIGAEHYLASKGAEVHRFFKGEENFNFDQLEGLDAIICIGKFSKSEIVKFRKIQDRLVFVDLYTQRINVTSIVLDFETAVYDVLTYLQSLGHNKIGYLGGVERLSDDTIYPSKRRRSFEEYCKQNNIQYEKYIYEDGFSISSGYRMCKSMIQSKTLPDAIFCGNDQIAFGALNALHEAGISVPKDISIVGFNDDQNSLFTTPSLTTVHAPTNFMGELAAKKIYDFLKSKKFHPTRTVLPCELVIRKSCGSKLKI
ncbi:MAG: LacI family DNA-binding transcriptional regulator [Erysipelotrichaceae bacterium]|nr:LacI family DNA-binding transcriptional regulator [Erysipelotrichaceae bacterium]